MAFKIPKAQSPLEALFLRQLQAYKLTDGMEREYKFAAPKRRWRFDFAWPRGADTTFNSTPFAVEIEGGIYTRGRHLRPKGYIADMEKYNEAGRRGWIVYRVSGEQVKSLEALKIVQGALGKPSGEVA